MRSRHVHDICLLVAFLAAIAAEHVPGAHYIGGLVAILAAIVSQVAFWKSVGANAQTEVTR